MKHVAWLARAWLIAATVACGPMAAPTAPAGPGPATGEPTVVITPTDGDAGPAPVVLEAVITGTVDPTPPAGTPIPDLVPQRVTYPLDLAAPRDPGTVGAEVRDRDELLRASSTHASDYPALLRGLADSYRELALTTARLGDQPRGEEAARKSLALYQRLPAEFPKFCVNPARATGCTDEVLYLIGRVDQLLADRDALRATYVKLFQDWPRSSYVPAAYFAIGDGFLAEAAADPSRLDVAEQAYTTGLVAAPPDHPLRGEAYDRIAYVHWKKGDFVRPLSDLVKALAHATAHPNQPGAAALTTRVRGELLAVYALAGDPARAFDFLAPLAGDRGAPPTAAFTMMATLRDYYLGRAAYREAIAIDRDLDGRDAPGRCRRAVEVAELAAWGLRADPDAVATELRSLTDAATSATADADCRAAAVSAIAAIALTWDLADVGSATAPGPRDPAALDRVAAVYRELVDRFTDDDFAAAAFPRLAAGDRPTRAALQARLARLRTLR